jgi:thymidylate synthase
MFCQFYVDTAVKPHVLSLQMYQRSADMGLGVPFNIASYALLLQMIAHVTNTTPGVFTHVIGDAHIYADHVEAIKEQITRQPKEFPILKIDNEASRGQGLKGLLDIKLEDLKLEQYDSWPAIKMKMSA